MRASQMTETTSGTRSEMQSTFSSQQAFERDYPRFDSLDPSLAGGFKIAFVQELPVKIKLLEGIESFHESTNVEPVLVKVTNKVTGKEKRVDTIKIELTTEADLFFNFVFEVNDEIFKQMKRRQGWNIDFDQLTATVIKQLISCQSDPKNFILSFEINKELNGELIITQSTEFKTIELMRLDFVTASQEAIRQSVVFRYNLVKAKNIIASQRVTDTLAILHEKNDALHDFVKKNTSLVKPKGYSTIY